MAGEHQAVLGGALGRAQACHEIDLVLALGHRRDAAIEAAGVEPVGEGLDRFTIAAVEGRITAADGAMTDQLGQGLLPVWNGHESYPEVVAESFGLRRVRRVRTRAGMIYPIMGWSA
ncbi:hypothetical protein GCM10028792_01030 [Salinisphaera aquimarina]